MVLQRTPVTQSTKEVPELMTLALKYQPTYLLTHLNLGRAFERLKNWQAARQAYSNDRHNPFHPFMKRSCVFMANWA